MDDPIARPGGLNVDAARRHRRLRVPRGRGTQRGPFRCFPGLNRSPDEQGMALGYLRLGEEILSFGRDLGKTLIEPQPFELDHGSGTETDEVALGGSGDRSTDQRLEAELGYIAVFFSGSLKEIS